MRKLVPIIMAAMLSACASFEKPASFALEAYPGTSNLERTLNQVNLAANRALPCPAKLCQKNLPTREELSQASFRDCKGYAMSKAYALQDQGVSAERMKIATFSLMDSEHMVLVVDDRYVLDNLDGSIREVGEYARFKPVLQAIPGTLLATSGRSTR